jgi:hypothetical protein
MRVFYWVLVPLELSARYGYTTPRMSFRATRTSGNCITSSIRCVTYSCSSPRVWSARCACAAAMACMTASRLYPRAAISLATDQSRCCASVSGARRKRARARFSYSRTGLGPQLALEGRDQPGETQHQAAGECRGTWRVPHILAYKRESGKMLEAFSTV